MSNDLKIRLANESEIHLINQKYDEVKFQHSDYANEIISIAELNDEWAGLGRLVRIDNDIYELGGIYVFEKYRNQKIATHIINFLINKLNNKVVYCIPFQSLVYFYKTFGFKQLKTLKIVPEKLIKKYTWCMDFYQEKVALLVKHVV